MIDFPRQIKIKIESFKSGALSYPAFVSSIDSYISAISETEVDLGTLLRSKWWVLEEINALALVERRLTPLPEHSEMAHKTIAELEQVLDGL